MGSVGCGLAARLSIHHFYTLDPPSFFAIAGLLFSGCDGNSI